MNVEKMQWWVISGRRQLFVYFTLYRHNLEKLQLWQEANEKIAFINYECSQTKEKEYQGRKIKWPAKIIFKDTLSFSLSY